MAFILGAGLNPFALAAGGFRFRFGGFRLALRSCACASCLRMPSFLLPLCAIGLLFIILLCASVLLRCSFAFDGQVAGLPFVKLPCLGEVVSFLFIGKLEHHQPRPRMPKTPAWHLRAFRCIILRALDC